MTDQELALNRALEEHRESLGGDVAVDFVDPTFAAGFRAGVQYAGERIGASASNHTPEAIEAIPDRFVQVFDGEALDPAVLAERTAYTRGQRDTEARRYTTTVKAVAQTLADTDARTDGQATYRDMAEALLVPGGPLEDTNTDEALATAWDQGKAMGIIQMTAAPGTFDAAHLTNPYRPAPTTETGEQK